MGKVVMHSVASLDGFIADHDGGVGPLHEWYFNGTTALEDDRDHTFDHSGNESLFKLSEASAGYVQGWWNSIGVIVMGRRLFDETNGWEGDPPAGDHVVVVSHRPKPDGWHPEASYHFVTDPAAAIETARRLAGDRTISVNAGIVGSQILTAGLVDEVAMDLVPVVFGSGRPYFHGVENQIVLDDPDTVIRGERVLHLHFLVRKDA